LAQSNQSPSNPFGRAFSLILKSNGASRPVSVCQRTTGCGIRPMQGTRKYNQTHFQKFNVKSLASDFRILTGQLAL